MDGELYFHFPSYSILNQTNKPVTATEFRIATWEKRPIRFGASGKGNHMYYPDIINTEVTADKYTMKGPISLISNGDISWLTTYEHASQDNLNGLFDTKKLGEGNLITDAMQGTKGVFNFPIEDENFKYLGITNQNIGENINVSVDILRGGYLDGEIIGKENPYSTVWTASGFYLGEDVEEGKKMIRHYLLSQINEKKASRKPEFYYNTWGLQREDNRKPLRGILTYERIFNEIEYASELGADIFVLDDGWENKQGEWFPNKERFANGLEPIKSKLDEYGMKMGLWFSPMGIDSTSQRYKDHPEWIIKDSEGKPILTQWNHPGFDFVSDFFDLFIQDCKVLIDQGCRFMKWDAINTFYSSLPNLYHGSDKYSEKEIRERYEYLLPIYVIRAMEVLTDYEPELTIEIDLTEARRVMVGLAPLSQGKLFWMNNGASSYNDYSEFRTKSMRTIANEYAGIIPLELFTYASYPQNISGFMKYNVHSALLAGHGFWGNLEIMNSEERKWIGTQVNLSKMVLQFLVDVNPEISGQVGDSPEIYKMINSNEAAGQIIMFSEEPAKQEIEFEIDSEKLLAVINNSYNLKVNTLNMSLQLDQKKSSTAVFMIPNQGEGVTIHSSTSQITNAKYQNGLLEYTVETAGEQQIWWNKNNGIPTLQGESGTVTERVLKNGYYIINLKAEAKESIVIGE